jgi:hypothetical protein
MRFALGLSLAVVVSAAPVVQDRTVAFDSGRWTMLDPGGRLMPYLGRPSLYLEGGIAIVADANFGDGTIEFDVAIHGNAGFAGVVFRGESADDYELIYLRTHRSRQWDALQYTPIFTGQHQDVGHPDHRLAVERVGADERPARGDDDRRDQEYGGDFGRHCSPVRSQHHTETRPRGFPMIVHVQSAS